MRACQPKDAKNRKTRVEERASAWEAGWWDVERKRGRKSTRTWRGERERERKHTMSRWTCQVALVVKKLPASAGDLRHGFYPWVWKIPWKRAR